MCNLYDVGPRPGHARADWEARAFEAVAELPKAYNLRPTDSGLVVLRQSAESEPVPRVQRWGFCRDFNPALTNAREDKLRGRMWRDAWRDKRRCLIAMRGFYEWSGPKGSKQTHTVRPADGSYLWVAGLWEHKRELGTDCYTMLTTAANAAMAPIHHRMPALIPFAETDTYLGADDPCHLLRPWEAELRIAPCDNPLRWKTPGPPREGGQGTLL